MADELFLSVAGHRATKARLVVPHQGPGFVEATLDEAVEITGKVDVRFADLEISGTVQDRATGTFAMGSAIRVVFGSGGWPTILAPKHYHNDASVKASQVATDAARAAGEDLGTFEPGAATLGVDYVRRAVAASTVLEDAAGGVPWWVDYEGRTQVQERPTGAVEGATVLEYDPRARLLSMAAVSLAGIAPGLTVSDERLGENQVIRDLEVIVEGGKLRIRAWCGDGARARGRLGGLLRDIARHAVSDRIWGVWRYRVVSMASDGRVRLQAVSKAAGLPDVLPCAQHPGAAGVHAELAPGSEVLVQFIEGSPTMPVVTGFATKGATGFVPTSLSLCEGTKGIARVGDQVKVFMSPGVPVPITGTIGGAPLVGNVVFASPLVGIIEGPCAQKALA